VDIFPRFRHAGNTYLQDQVLQDLGVLALIILQILGLLGSLLEDTLQVFLTSSQDLEPGLVQCSR
jgi:hypothetical protein